VRQASAAIKLVEELRVVVLQNEVLRASFAIDLGGRLWSLVHWPSCVELLHANPGGDMTTARHAYEEFFPGATCPAFTTSGSSPFCGGDFPPWTVPAQSVETDSHAHAQALANPFWR
jgi:hypothetical protein